MPTLDFTARETVSKVHANLALLAVLLVGEPDIDATHTGQLGLLLMELIEPLETLKERTTAEEVRHDL